MSHFTTVATKITDSDALLSALEDLGFPTERVNVSETPIPLRGFLGDRREQQAHIVIPKEYVGTHSNDIGFELTQDGTYRAWISEFDRGRFDSSWLEGLTARYAYHSAVATMTKQGFTVADEQTGSAGEIRLVLRRYR